MQPRISPVSIEYLIRPVNESAVDCVFTSKLGTGEKRQDPLPVIKDADNHKELFVLGGNYRLHKYKQLVESKAIPPDYRVEIRLYNQHTFRPGDKYTTPLEPALKPLPWQFLLTEAAYHNNTSQNVVKVSGLTKAWEVYKLILAAPEAPLAPTKFAKYYQEEFGVTIPGAWKEKNRSGKATGYSLEDAWLETYHWVKLWQDSEVV